MPIFEWTPNLSVGVAEIDAEHRDIGNLLNELYDLRNQSEDQAECVELVSALIGRLRSHFSTEERYFRDYGYENAEAHHAEHERLLRELGKKRLEIESATCAAPNLARYLQAWLTTHVLVTDKEYVEFFRAANVR